ncbi:MAG: insulinase family protein [Deltaproteobacteria bacterium]|nr:insulinase family protein [Deltaproteobacteria bacterium]
MGSWCAGDEHKRTGPGCYQTCFSPKNALFLVVGKVDKSLFQKKVQSVFGSGGSWTSGTVWNSENKKKDLIIYEDKRLATKKDEILLVERLGLNQAQVKIGFKAPLIYAPEHHALLVANALLGEYFNSRLNSIIRDKLALTYAIESYFVYNKNFAEFSVSSSTKNETIGQLIKKTLEILKDFEGGGISEEEIKMSKDYLIGSYSLSVSTLQVVALNWLIGYVFGLGDQYINDFIPKIKQVTHQEVIQAVKKYFLLDKVTIVIAGDPKPLLKSLKESDFKKIKQIRLDSLL